MILILVTLFLISLSASSSSVMAAGAAAISSSATTEKAVAISTSGTRNMDFDKEFEEYEIRGWKVHIEKTLKDELDRIIVKMEEGFDNFIDSVPSDLLTELRKTAFWVSQENNYPLREADNGGTIAFHEDVNFLIQHELDTRMVQGVHVINPIAVFYTNEILSWGPYVFLHELAHAYEFKNRQRLNVIQHYNAAMDKGLYTNVPTREDPDVMGPAYASVNEKEWFAELTEAYFGVNDYFPKTRDELKTYDPESYDFIEKAWTA